MNPELQRNLWLSAAPRKLALAGAVLGGLFVAVWLIDRGRHAYAITLAGATVFFAAALLWAPGAARRSVTREARADTWDAQRLCALSPAAMTWGKLAGATAASWAFAGGGLAIAALQLSSTSSLSHAGAWVLAALCLAVTVQSSGLASGLIDVRRARATGRSPSLRSPGLAVLVLGVLGLALLVWARSRFDTVMAQLPLVGAAAGAPAEVAWYGVRVSPIHFAAASLFVSALWALIWAWRLMRLELQWSSTGPGPGLAFLACAWRICVRLRASGLAGDDPDGRTAGGWWPARLRPCWPMSRPSCGAGGQGARTPVHRRTKPWRGRRPGRMLSHLPLTVAADRGIGLRLPARHGGRDPHALTARVKAQRSATVTLAALRRASSGATSASMGVAAASPDADDAATAGRCCCSCWPCTSWAARSAGLVARGTGGWWPCSGRQRREHPRLQPARRRGSKRPLAWGLAAIAVSRPVPPPRTPPPETSSPPPLDLEHRGSRRQILVTPPLRSGGEAGAAS